MVQDLGHFDFLARNRKMQDPWSSVELTINGRRKKEKEKEDREKRKKTWLPVWRSGYLDLQFASPWLRENSR